MKNFLRRLCVVVLTLAMCLPTLPMTAYAAAGDEPAHSKTVTANEDGSFTIALNVTGDSEKNVTKVNVVVVLDSSGSMTTNTGNTETTYTATNTNGTDLYGLVDGEYVALHTETSGWGWFTEYTYYYPWTGNVSTSTEYTGQRYSRQTGNQNRMQAASAAVNNLAESLLSNNGGDNPTDTVEMVLVDFDTHASTKTVRTDASSFASDVASVNAQGGTNWEAALSAAKSAINQEGEKTYIIFVSDGNPTFRDSANGYTQDWRQSDQVYGTGQDSGQGSADNITRCYNAAKLVADTIVADDSYVLYTIGVYGNVDRMENLGGTYYAADNTAALQDALNQIWEDIMLSGIGSVEIDDGTTTKVSAGDVDVALITIDESSFKYYRAGGDDGEGNDKYDSTLNGGLGEEWTGDDVPPAKLDSDTGTVIWDMGDGVLENEVTYTVTFVAWPSQYALDLMADIKNDPSAYDKLQGDVTKYFTRDGEIMTNTGATISYTDTRTGETTSQAFNPVEPQATESVESLAISKDWSNLLDPQTAKIPTSVAIYVNRDEEQAYKLVLSEDNSWKSSAYISIGVMTVDKTTGKVDVKATGHDFTFSEDSDVAYTWEIVAPTVHPMKINGTNYSLVLQEKAVAGDDGSMYQKIGSDEYYRLTSGGAIYKAEPIASGGAAAELNASNERRSFFDLQKKVNGDANPDDLFRFELTVDNLDVTTPTEDDDAWFSVWDNSIGGLVKDLDTNATPEENPSNGYYHFTDGGSAYVMMKAGQSLRVLNTKTNTQITVKEVLETGGAYTMDTMEFTKRTGNETSETLVTTSSAVENTILIDQTNTAFKMVYTNDYGLGALKIVKTVEGVTMSAISSAAKFTVTDGANYTTDVAFSAFEENPSDAAVKSYTLYDLMPGTTYTVSETGFEVDDYKLTTTGLESGKQVTKGGTAEFDVTNTYTRETGALTITKAVEGLDADATTPAYSFSIAGDEFTTEASITLEEGATSGSITLSDLPTGTYTVTEDTSKVGVTNYTFDTAASTTTASAVVTADTTASAIITNAYTKDTGSLTISKTVVGLTAEERAELEVKFTVTGEGGFTTDAAISFAADTQKMRSTLPVDETQTATKTYTIEGLPVGSYTVTEDTSSAAVEGFYLTTTPETTTAAIAKDETTTVSFTNTYAREAGNITITKTFTGLDADTELPAVEFTVSNADGSVAKTVTYGAFTDGSYTFEDLPTGSYTVSETTSSALVEGFTLTGVNAAATTTVAIAEGETKTVSFENVYEKDLGSLKIKKTITGVDADAATDLKFIVTATETATGEDYTTEVAFTDFGPEAIKAVKALKPLPVDTDITATLVYTISDLPVGTYTVTETGTAIDGYVLDDSSVTTADPVTVEKDETASVSFTNVYAQLGDDLVITKTVTGLVNGETIPTYQFEVKNSKGDVVTTASISGLELDTPKSVTVKDLPADTYTVTELETTETAIEGYTLEMPASDTVEISEESDDREAEFTNEYKRITGTLTIVKTYEGLGEGMEPELIITVTSTAKDFGTDGELELSYEDLDENGEYTTTAPFGEYEISEQVLDIDGYTFLEDESTTSAIAEIVENGDEAELALYNKYEQDLATLVITKTIIGLDEEDFPEDLSFTVTGKLDSGDEYTTEVAFADFGDAYEAPVKAVKAVRHLDPDESKSTTKSYVLEGIPTGEYTVTETGAAVEDYFLTQSDDVTVTLEKDATEEVKFTNTYGQEVGDVTVIKVVEGDAEDAPEGTTFELQDAEGNVVASATYADFEEDKDGNMSYTFTDVIVGSYTVVEDEDSAQLDGYTLEVEGNDAEAQDLADEGTLTFTITNTYTAQTGTVTIVKKVVSEEGFTVPDEATFVITGELLNGESFNQTVTYADFENGVFVIEDAPAGSYKVVENASSASIKDVSLSITGDNNKSKDLEGNGEVEFEITNTYGLDTASFTIIKTSKKHATPADAKFTITSDSEYFVETTIKYSDFTDGKYEFKDVPVGTYTIVEDEKSAAVSGYELEVEYATGKSIVLDLGENVEFEIINTYEKKDTPPDPPVLDTENHDAYIIGYPDGTVQPEGNITRAEVVTIFFRLLTDRSREQYWETDNEFDDVNVENWFNNAVSTMANAGIIKGYDDGKFKPYNNVTRAELATMAARFLTDTKGGNDSKNYSDTEDSWAKAEIELASRYGIVNGYDDGTFKPNQAITRAEAMTLINRLLKRNPHEDHLLKSMITWPDNADKSVWYYAQVQEATNGHTYTWGSDGNGKYEYWKGLRKVRDWAALETEWANANSGK